MRHIEEVLPLIYTPTVGEACQRFSAIFRKPRGLFLSYPNRSRIAEMLAHPRYDEVRVIVVSDGERILGLGDQGAGGMGIPVGKLSLYTGCAGIYPGHTLPILLDTGTNNPERLADPLYIGWRHERVRGAEYDDFVESFVSAVEKRWPHVLLQWEDFAGANAGRLLARYRDRLCTFNDDIQGTAAVAAGTLLSAINVTGIPLKEQRVALLGAGSAGIGICTLIVSAMVEAGLGREEAFARFYAVDRDGLLVEGMSGILPAQEPFVAKKSAVAGWTREHPSKIGLFDVVANAKPTVLIGVSGQPGTFTEAAIRSMAKNCARPVIFPLSNPTARSEATAADIMRWTDGRGPRHSRRARPPGDGCDVHGGGEGARRTFAGTNGQERPAAARAQWHPRGFRSGRTRRRPTGPGGRRRSADKRGRARAGGPRHDLGAFVPALYPQEGLRAQPGTPQRRASPVSVPSARIDAMAASTEVRSAVSLFANPMPSFCGSSGTSATIRSPFVSRAR